MKLTKQIDRQKIHILALAVVFLLALVSFYIPRWRKAASTKREIDRLKEKINCLQIIAADPAAFGTTEERNLSLLKAIQAKIPQKPEITPLIEQITQPAKELDFTLLTIQPGKAAPGELLAPSPDDTIIDTTDTAIAEPETANYMETPITITLEADYQQFAAYLESLRQLSRLILVKNFSIHQNTEIAPRLAINLKIAVYHYEED